jgi:4-azaleucine resistance transporter AzlC
MKSAWQEFREGVIDIVPVLVAAVPIGLLWGTLAVGKGMTALEAGLTSVSVFAGAAQYVAIDLWREPVPWLLLTATVLIVNVRHVMMGASLSRHMGAIRPAWRAPLMFLMADENWAFSERRALTQPLTMPYYLGLALPMIVTWTASSVVGAIVGRNLGDPAAYGFDFAFSALFIGILAGFWKGPKTGAVLAVSAIVAAIAKLTIAGAWYIVLGGIAGVIVAAALHAEEEAEATP